MHVYRIAKSEKYTTDLSGLGSYLYGGRWNSKGTYMVYTSQNSSLAYLETLVHLDEFNLPPNLYLTIIEIRNNKEISELPDTLYPPNWQLIDNLGNQALGDQWMDAKQYLGIKVRSAVNPSEFNVLLNPQYPGFHEQVKVLSVEKLNIDSRLIR